MSRIGCPHAGCVNRLNGQLTPRVVGRGLVAVQNPIRLGQSTEPEPDVVLAVPRDDGYGDGHPNPAEILHLIEAMDASSSQDCTVKLPFYAAGIRGAWSVDLANALLEVYRRPLNDQ
jgi:hypothetical protein